ncbi:WXG100 family type VII secretion target, partial [Kitasatospora griseola]|uniref:WXG100 family type VII secretion target n=1 Tax=Kitasatospora griseola TaxID=2064 RepID=UPI00357159A6
MAVELPEPLQWVLLLLAGCRWPEADEDQLRDMADHCRKAAETLKDAGQGVDAAIKRAVEGQQGNAAEALTKYWATYTVGKGTDDDPGRLTATIKALDGMGDMLEQVANSAETAKIQIVAQLGILAFELATAEAEAPITAGASMLQVPGFIAAARAFVQTTLKTLLKDMVKMAAKQAAQMAAINLMAQGIELAEGHRKSIDWKEVGDNAKGGAIGGAAGHLIGAGLGGAAGKMGLGNLANSAGGKMAIGAATGVGADAATQYITTGKVDTSSLLGSGLSGGAGAGLSHMATRPGAHPPAPKPGDAPHIPGPVGPGEGGRQDGPPKFTKPDTSSGDSGSSYHGPSGDAGSSNSSGSKSRSDGWETS